MTNIQKIAQKFAGKIIDFKQKQQQKRQQKQELENRQRGGQELIQFLGLMNSKELFTGKNLDVDALHQARKAAEFPPIPLNSPVWIQAMMDAIDDPDPIARRAKFKTHLYGLAANSPDLKQRKKAEEQFEQDRNQELQEFLIQAKRGWLKFSKIKDWIRQYPILFLGFKIGDIISGAQEYLFKQNSINVKKEKLAAIVTQAPQNIPIGTVLYYTEFANYLDREWVKKIAANTWESNEGSLGNDQYIASICAITDNDFAGLLYKPEAFFTNKIENYSPSEQEIAGLINFYLKNKPEKFLDPQVWKYDLSTDEGEE